MSPAILEQDNIPLPSRVIHKFYEPLVLLNALSFATRETAPSGGFDATIDVADLEQLYKAFVYKLGHSCDSRKGGYGATITSFCIMKDPERDGAPHYWFASNQRTYGELEATAEYMRNLLRKVGQPFKDLAQCKKDLLSDILWFNRLRVIYYLRQMSNKGTKCIEYCQRIPDEGYEKLAEKLSEMLELVEFDTSSTEEKEQFTTHTLKVIRHLERLCDSPEGQLMAERARTGRDLEVPSEECWPDLQHMINRTIAYSESVRFILAAKARWPRLFVDFKVSYIESSQRMERPFRNKSRTADSIVGRMASKEEMINKFREFVKDLQKYNLDKLILEVYQDPNFRPIVHSEVLLLDYLDKKGLLEPQLFFNEWMYIGSSKPTCKLCHHYFKSHHTPNVGHRPSHGNLYLHWRVPDVLQSQGERGTQRRQVMVDRLLEKVRKEAFDIVTNKSSSMYKGDDSFTYSAAMPGRSTIAGSVANLDDLASMIGHMDLSDRAGDFDDDN
ncbi:hypothetical protein FDECE_8230 [Fusarium decemcellulare]|nr:hypothetical protein FDECE_8230 [Fusarium decemcellulare]